MVFFRKVQQMPDTNIYYIYIWYVFCSTRIKMIKMTKLAFFLMSEMICNVGCWCLCPTDQLTQLACVRATLRKINTGSLRSLGERLAVTTKYFRSGGRKGRLFWTSNAAPHFCFKTFPTVKTVFTFDVVFDLLGPTFFHRTAHLKIFQQQASYKTESKENQGSQESSHHVVAL